MGSPWALGLWGCGVLGFGVHGDFSQTKNGVLGSRGAGFCVSVHKNGVLKFFIFSIFWAYYTAD